MIVRMILKLKPEHPLVWRSPDTIQVGVDRQIVIVDGVTPALEVLLAALQSGVPKSGLYMLGEEAGADAGMVSAFLERIRPALVEPQHDDHHTGRAKLVTPNSVTPKSVVIDGEGRSADRLRGVLGELGIPADSAEHASEDSAGLVILFGTYVFEPERHQRWLRRDVPHLPVLFGDNGAHIGPLVEPGIGPCLFCVELERTDADPAWPAIAAQLANRHAPAESMRLSIDVVARVAGLVDDHLAGRSNRLLAKSLGLDLHGRVTRRVHRFQERCGCRTLSGLTAGATDADLDVPALVNLRR